MSLNQHLSLQRPKSLLIFSMVSVGSVPDLTAEFFLGALLLAGIKFLIQSRSLQPYSIVFARDE